MKIIEELNPQKKGENNYPVDQELRLALQDGYVDGVLLVDLDHTGKKEEYVWVAHVKGIPVAAQPLGYYVYWHYIMVQSILRGKFQLPNRKMSKRGEKNE